MSFHRSSYIYEGISPIYLLSPIYVFISVYVLAMDRRQFLFLLLVLFFLFIHLYCSVVSGFWLVRLLSLRTLTFFFSGCFFINVL